MASTLSEYSVGTVVVKRCKFALADNVACNCWMLLSQTDESDIESRAQEWFNAHGKTAEISEVCSWRRCKLKFYFRDKFNIVTTWISPVTKLQCSTILVHKDEFVQHHPHGLIWPIALLHQEVAHRFSDGEDDSEQITREGTLDY